MKTREAFRAGLLAGLMTMTPAATAAAEATGPEYPPEGAAVRVINNYQTRVEVFVEDAAGRMHRLAYVASGELALLEISEEIVSRGTYRVKVFPSAPVWAPAHDDFGIRTPDVRLPPGQVLNFWVEPNLEKSTLEVTNG